MPRPLCSLYAGAGVLALAQSLWLPALVLVLGTVLTLAHVRAAGAR